MFRQTAAYSTTVLFRDFSEYTSRQLQKLGLNRGMLFLVIYVGKHPGCSQSELTEALGLDWGYGQRSILKLVEDGFLLREKRGRAYHLDLSEKGQEAFAIGHQVFFDWDQENLSCLDETEQTQLLALLEKITQKVAGKRRCTKP